MLHFVSDIHLSATAPATAQRFFDYLSGPAAAASAIYILGDLVDSWVGDDAQDTPFYAELCARFSALRAQGPTLYFLHGNRDFLIGRDFCAAAGLTLLPEETVISIAGIPTLLMHGDALCTLDTAYQTLRAQLHDPAWQANFLALPLSQRLEQARLLRHMSMTETAQKNTAITDVCTQTVRDTCARHQVSQLIHGHTHRPAVHQDGAITRYVLSDWSATRGAALILPD